MKRLLYIFLLFVNCSLLCGQEPLKVTAVGCDAQMVIEDAERLYQEGFYDKCIGSLEELIRNCELSKRQRIVSNEILARAYIETDDPLKAGEALSSMLRLSPHYELNEEENPESFNRLVKKYNIHPKLSFGLRNTLDWMNYRTRKIYTINGISYDEPYSKELVGILNDFNWAYYGWGELEFDHGISINTDLIFKWTNFVRNISTPGFELTFKEQDNYVEIPLYLKKYFKMGKNVLPFITGGVGWLYMTSATGNATKDYPQEIPSVTTGDISMLGMRNISTFEWLAGAGIGYRMKNVRIFADIRYYRGMNSITNPEKSLTENYLLNDFLYVDNFVRFNHFEIGGSLSYTFIHSVKKKK